MFNLLLNLSVILIQFSAVFALKAVVPAQDPETGKMTRFFLIPCRIFFGLFGLNVFLYLLFNLSAELSLGSVGFYFALGVLGREMWLAWKAKENAIERLDSMGAIKKTIVMALFLYAMFWLSKELFAVG